MAVESYPDFLANIFRVYSGLNASTISKIVDDEDNMNTFTLAITHESYDAENNYEFLEFYGDNFVNTAIVEYLHRRFPDIKAEGQLTQIKHNLVKDQTFSAFAGRLGLINHVRGDRDYIFGTGEYIAGEPVEGNHVMKVQEDLFEAFIGATVIVLDKIYPHSGYSIVYNIIETLLKDVPIETRVSKIKHPKMEMNDIVTSEQVKWKLGENPILEYRMVGKIGRKQRVQAILHYGGEEVRSYKGGTSILLGTGANVTRKLAEKDAAFGSLSMIKRLLASK
jgi:dsRNA-specific ribonuclease